MTEGGCCWYAYAAYLPCIPDNGNSGLRENTCSGEINKSMIWHRYAMLLTYAGYLRQLGGTPAAAKKTLINKSMI